MTLPIGTKYVYLLIYGLGELNDGDFYEFTDAAMVVGSTAEVTGQTLEVEPSWLDVIGPTHTIDIDRVELNVGTLSALIRDSTLDPSQEDLIRPGRGIRAVLSTGEQLFNGKILKGRVTYDFSAPVESKATRIEVTAADALADLSNVKRTEGVATIGELSYVLDGTGVPYIVNDSSTSISLADVEVVSTNENASAVDQVALTRDTALGYAWLDRTGRMQAWDRDLVPAEVAATYTAADYNALDIDFDTDRCINTLTIKVQSVDPVTGEGTEVTFGPWTDADSVRTWGARAAEFTVHGLDTEELDSYAAAVLAANSTPQIRINSVTLALATTDQVLGDAVHDLYDLITVSNERAGRTQTARVVSVSHRITPTQWRLELGFAAQGGVAPPQVIPAPGTSGGLTQAQRLRPLGELTMWVGTTSQVPAGWLVCDGSTFSAVTYPRLAELLGGTTLPNLIDRLPIGAGVKELGTSGGDPTKILTVANLPPHAHTVPAHSHSVSASQGTGGQPRAVRGDNVDAVDFATQSGGGGSTGNGPGEAEPVDVMPPWRAVHFIIRAA